MLVVGLLRQRNYKPKNEQWCINEGLAYINEGLAYINEGLARQ